MSDQRFIKPKFGPIKSISGLALNEMTPVPVPTEEQKTHLKKWVAALRSGKYKQSTYFLHRTSGSNAGYCCLGVAWDVCGKEVPEAGQPTPDVMSAHLPKVVENYYGIRSCSTNLTPIQLPFNDMVTGICYTSILAKLNDGLKYSFGQIADLIEAHLINKEWNDDNTITEVQSNTGSDQQPETVG